MERELQTPDYAAILADMEAKKVALENAIAALRTALSAGLLGASGDFQGGLPSVNPISAVGNRDLPRGAFLGMAAGPAIKLYLSAIRKKQTNKEIAQALRDGGLESAGNFDNYITSALFRLRKDGAVLRFDDGWGLSEWYNEAFRAKLGVAKPSNGKKPAKRAKAKRKTAAKKPFPAQSSVATEAETTVKAPPAPFSPVGIDARVFEYLKGQLPSGESIKDIADRVQAQVGVVNFSAVRMLKKGIVRRDEDGKIYAVKDSQ